MPQHPPTIPRSALKCAFMLILCSCSTSGFPLPNIFLTCNILFLRGQKGHHHLIQSPKPKWNPRNKVGYIMSCWSWWRIFSYRTSVWVEPRHSAIAFPVNYWVVVPFSSQHLGRKMYYLLVCHLPLALDMCTWLDRT